MMTPSPRKSRASAFRACDPATKPPIISASPMPRFRSTTIQSARRYSGAAWLRFSAEHDSPHPPAMRAPVHSLFFL